MKRTTITMKPTDFKRIKAFCKKEDIKISTLFRKCAIKHIKNKESKRWDSGKVGGLKAGLK